MKSVVTEMTRFVEELENTRIETEIKHRSVIVDKLDKIVVKIFALKNKEPTEMLTKPEVKRVILGQILLEDLIASGEPIRETKISDKIDQ
jgi:hypothetical protein